MIDIPVAAVSPLSGDFTIQYAGTGYQTNPQVPLYHTSLNSQGVLTVGILGRAEVGVTAFSGDPEQGFSGQVLLLRQQDFNPTSPLHFLPNVALGIRNVGPYSHIDRFNLGYGESVNPNGGSAPVIRVDSVYASFDTKNSVYGVATEGFMLSDLKSSLPEIRNGFHGRLRGRAVQQPRESAHARLRHGSALRGLARREPPVVGPSPSVKWSGCLGTT